MSAVVMAAAGAGLGAAVGAGIFCRAVFMPRSQLCGRVIFRGPDGEKTGFALTFDDGPNPDITPEVLACLNRHGAPAAFFVVGQFANRHPDLIREIHAAGHIVGNHSFTHAHLGSMRRDRYWEDQIRTTDDVIEEIIGCRPAFFRPPMGFKTFHIMRAARRNGHAVITWSRRGFDGVRAWPEQIVHRLSNVGAGDIILMHDGAVPPFRISPGVTVASLDQLLNRWRESRIMIMPLDQMLGIPAYAKTPKCAGDAAPTAASTAAEHAASRHASSRATA